jgi:UDP-N-acetyl-alpha-D-quinovosamine dehydrogenase
MESEGRLARILVTGAAGFLGRALCRGLVQRGHAVIGATRGAAAPLDGVALRAAGTIGTGTDWSSLLADIEIVVHLAARAHAPASPGERAEEAAAGAALVRAAAAHGIRRVVQMSSLRAMGQATPPGRSFRAEDDPRPTDPYGRAKLATEEAMRQAAAERGLDLVILRPPLVHGPGVKANFRALLRLVASGLPLPFAAVANRRSLIFIDNLVDLTVRAAVARDAAGQVLLLRDADPSTPALVRALAEGLGRRPRLFAVPDTALALLRAVPGAGRVLARLTLSLAADDSATRAALRWRPPVAGEAGLAVTARAFRDEP